MESETEGDLVKKNAPFKISDNGLELPENFELGLAIGGGDCFFDSAAQGLKLLMPEKEFTAKSLREVCKSYARRHLEDDRSWLKKALENEHEPIVVYVSRVEFTANDIQREPGSTKVLGLTSPIWGRSDIEGRIISEAYGVKLHVIEKQVVEGKELWLHQVIDSEGSMSVDNVNYDDRDYIHIVNRGNSHFEPILCKNRQNSLDLSDTDDEIKPEEELMYIVRCTDSEDAKLRQIQRHDKEPKPFIDFQGKGGNTPLHIAIRKRELLVIKRLVKLGARIDIKNDLGKTQLMTAAGRQDIVDILMSADQQDEPVCQPQPSQSVPKHLDQNLNKSTVTRKKQQTNPNLETADPIHGWIYQIKLLMLFLKRGVSYKYSFRLGTEIKEAKKFDDLLFECTIKGRTEYRLLQAKHRRDDNKKITVDDLLTESDSKFSLIKYFFSYHDLKKEKLFKSGSIINVVVCTNVGLNVERLENWLIEDNRKDNILDTNTGIKKPSRYRFNQKISSLLKSKLEKYNLVRLARRLAECLLKGNPIQHHQEHDIFKSYHCALAEEIINVNTKQFTDNFITNNSLSQDAKRFREAFKEELIKQSKNEYTLETINGAIIDKIKIFKNKPVCLNLSKRFGTGKDRNWPENAISDSDIKEFLEHFMLAVDQPNEEQLGKIVKREIGKGFDFVTTENVYNKLFMTICNWLQGKERGKFLTYEEGKEFFEEARRGIPIWFGVRDPVISFTGREGELTKLHEVLQRTESKDKLAVISQTASVTGLGGIGKSELARKYIKEYSKDYDNKIVWINAESYQTLVESFHRLAQDKLEISTKDTNGKEKNIESIVEDVYRFFSKGKSLFIFDNAEKLRAQKDGDEGIHIFLPSLPHDADKPYVIITSRNQKWGRMKVIKLGTFTEKEAKDFIRKSLKIEDGSQENEIKQLAKTLQCFPLALQQAVAFINERDVALKNIDSKFDINDYLRKYNEETEKLLDFKFPDDSSDLYTKTTFTTWKITTDKIRHVPEYGDKAADILDTVAYFAPDNIPVEIFLESELIDGNKETLGFAIQLLKQYSMIDSDEKESSINVHRLVQCVTRIYINDQNKEDQVVGDVFYMLHKSYPYNRDKSEDYAKKRLFLPHIEVFLSHIVERMEKKPEDKDMVERNYLETLTVYLSDGCIHLGSPRRGKESLERILEGTKKLHGSDHFQVARITILMHLGIFYGELGDRCAQKKLFKRAIEIKNNLNGPGHFEVGDSLVNLDPIWGLVAAWGDPKKENKCLEMTLPILEKHYGPDHYKVALNLVILGSSYKASGDPKKGKEFLERALHILERHYGPDHIEVAQTLMILGSTYKVLGDPKKGKEFLERALPILEKHHGRDHYKVALNLEILGSTYKVLGDPKKGKELLERALPILQKHYGPDHIEVAQTLMFLGSTYQALGDLMKGKKLLERALPILQKHYGPDHIEVAQTLMILGSTYKVLGEPQKGKEFLERALPILEKHYGRDHYKVGLSLEILGSTYKALGDPMKGKELLERALPILLKHYGPDHFEVAQTLIVLGSTYKLLGDPKKGKQLLERALPVLLKHYGSDHIEVAQTRMVLGSSYELLGDPKKGKEFLERALPVLLKHYGSNHIEVAQTRMVLGSIYQVLGDPKRGKEFLERALPILLKHYGPDHFDVALTLGNLGTTYGDLGDPKTGNVLFKRALPILEKNYGPDHFNVAQALVNLGSSYNALGDHWKGKVFLERALPILEKHYGPDHGHVAQTLVNLGATYRNLGDPKKGKEILERALPILEKQYGPNHIQVGIAQVNLGDIYEALGDPKKNKEFLERALTTLEKYNHCNVPDLKMNLFELKRIEQLHSDNGITYLHYMAQKDNTEMIKLLLKGGANIESTDINDWTPLHYAAFNNNISAVGTLLNSGANINALSQNNRKPSYYTTNDSIKEVLDSTQKLFNVVRQMSDKSIVQKLLESGASVNAVCGTDRLTVLHFAVAIGNIDIIEAILESKPNINATDEDGWTALHYAVEECYVDIVQLLIDNQADINIRNNNGYTPIGLAWGNLSRNLKLYQKIINIFKAKC